MTTFKKELLLEILDDVPDEYEVIEDIEVTEVRPFERTVIDFKAVK